jgi:hypothetical protein
LTKKLLSLRISFFILGAICFLAFIYHFDNLGYFVAVVFIAISIITIRNFIVFPDSFQVSKYYFFGLIKRRWQFHKGENLHISTLGADFGEDADNPDIGDIEVGCLFFILSIFVRPKIVKKEFTVEKRSETNVVLERVHIFLDKAAFNYLKPFMSESQCS